MIPQKSRVLAFLLTVALVLSPFPVVSMAEEPVDQWQQISFADIKETDPILITMKVGSKYYLITTDRVTSGAPSAYEATVNTDGAVPVLETANAASLYAWNFLATENGYQIKSTVEGSENYLSISSSSNTGVRITNKTSDWTLDGNYLCAKDPGGTLRYLGVYNSSDWRSYTNTSNKIADQEATFWVLKEQSIDPDLKPKAKGVSVDLAPGAYLAGTEVNLSSKESGAEVFYHTGDENWIKFSDPIVLTESVIITAKSVKEGMRDSDPESFEYIAFTVGEERAVLVRDIAELASGDRIIIAAVDYDRSMGKNQKNNNRDIAYIVKDGDYCYYDKDTQILTLEAGTTEDTYSFYAADGNATGYLYVPMDSGNYLRSNEEKDENADFRISISEDGIATIVGTEAKLQNTILYNHGSSKIFSCYASGGSQKPICIYKLEGQDRPGLPEGGDVVAIYNLAARGALSDTVKTGTELAISTVPAQITAGAVKGSNGTVLFKVEQNGDSYRFYNEAFGYLCAGRSSAYYSAEDTQTADWTLEAYNGGYRMISEAVPEHTLQYAMGKFAAYDATMTESRDGLTYHFFPCINENLTAAVVNEPQVVFGSPAPANKGQSYLLHFSVDAIFGAEEIHAYLGSQELPCSLSYGRYAAELAAELVSGETLTVRVEGKDPKGTPFSGSVEIIVKDEPVISDLKPVSNSQTKDNKRPTISARVNNAGENPIIDLLLNGGAVNASYKDGLISYTPNADLSEGRVNVSLTVTRQDGKSVSKSWSFIVGESKFTLLFGQLHSHTGEYSDGSGTLQSALEHIEGLPEEAKVDFVAFTDHSNYFDTADAPNPEEALYDLSLATPDSRAKWTAYKDAMAQFNTAHAGDILALPGFEMTWSGGPGHMNTFVTEGIVSRNNKTLNEKSADAGMRAYYELLTREEGAEGITQLNHPGTTFGNFTDFAYWNPQADSRVYLVEVGNGEGPIHGGGYYPSYEQYTLALDKGWHVAPTNNQDNHKGKWGNANNGRDVILAESFTEEAIYDAIRSYRVYATEDKNLEILYTVNELPMGTMIENVPETLEFDVSLMDPDSDDSITCVELIVNSGKVAYTWDNAQELASGHLTATLEPAYSYYYLRVTQADKDIAVTAPVWVGEALKLGIRESTLDADIAVVGEELTINTNFYNEEYADAAIKSIVYSINGNQVLHVDNELHLLSAGTDVVIPWSYTPTEAKKITITITAIVDYDNRDYTFTSSVELNVVQPDEVTYMGIDASHQNEYVTGKYSQMMNNFSTLAMEAGIRCNLLTGSEALIAACKNEKYTAIVLNVPTRQYSQGKSYTAEELEALAAFNARGGILIISNLGDKFDKLEPHMAATQNALLEALGSCLRFSDDAVREGSYNSVYAYSFGEDPLVQGIEDSIVFYNGSSVYAVDQDGEVLDTLPSHISAVLFGNYKTESRDEDGDGLGGSSTMKYSYNDEDYGLQSRLLLMAADRQEGKGMIFVSGVPFMNDYNILFPAENGNNALAENLLKEINPVKITPIAEVRKQTEVGYKFNIEGVVTSNASGYDKDTAFFDCIYVQDETAGINCFPVAGNFKIGDIVQIKGQTEFYIGEPELQVQTIEKIGETTPLTPVEVTSAQINDRSVEGSLITLKGVVTKITLANGLVESIYIKDAEGVVARAFIDGYITSAKTIPGLTQGCAVSVTGIGSYDNTYAIEHDSYARIRVRDRDDIVTSVHEHTVSILAAVAPTCTETGLTEGQWCEMCEMILIPQEEVPAKGHSFVNGVCSVCGAGFPFTDVPENIWYRKAVEYVYENKLMNGMTATTYAPNKTLTRAMLVTILYRMAGSPEVELKGIFTDVAPGIWYSDAIQWGYDNDIVKGVAADRFAPDRAVSREQMVTFLYRYAKYAGYDVSKAETTDLSSYVDVSTVSGYAADGFRWAVGEGIVNGMGNNNLAPQGTATRAQVAQVIMKLDLLKK